jgi:hypothetical protein
MKKISHLIIAVFFLCLSVTAWGPVCAQDKSDTIEGKKLILPPVTIMGTISNIAEMREHISSKTYLQIVQATDGKINLHFVNGELMFNSTLSKIPIPKDGMFVFKKVRNLKLGESYTIVTQLIDNSSNRSMWLIMDGNPLIIDFPLGYKYATDTKEIKIDLLTRRLNS